MRLGVPILKHFRVLCQGKQLYHFDFYLPFFRIHANLKVFPSTISPYHGVKVTHFGKSVKFLTREFSTFTTKSLQNNISTGNAISKLNLMNS